MAGGRLRNADAEGAVPSDIKEQLPGGVAEVTNRPKWEYCPKCGRRIDGLDDLCGKCVRGMEVR